MSVRKCRQSYFLFLCAGLLSAKEAAFHLHLRLDLLVVLYLRAFPLESGLVQVVGSSLI